MKDSDFIALIYAKVMKDESMWEALINKVCEEECAKGKYTLVMDIVDANNGKLHTIPSVPPTSRCELSSIEYATNNERYGAIIHEQLWRRRNDREVYQMWFL